MGTQQNGYVGFYGGKRIEVHADTTIEAQEKLVPLFQKTSRRKVKGYNIAVVLAEIDGQQITHKPLF